MVDTVTIDADVQLRRIEASLGELSSKAPTVLTKALNSTARAVRKQLSKDMKQRYQLTKDKGRLNATKAAKIKNATRSSMTATIRSTGQKNDLMDFFVNPTAVLHGKGDVAYLAGVLKSSRKHLTGTGGTSKPFVVQFQSGHIAIVERVIGKPMVRNPKKEFLQKLLSPAVPHMMFREEEREIAVDIVDEKLSDMIDMHVQKTLARLGK